MAFEMLVKMPEVIAPHTHIAIDIYIFVTVAFDFPRKFALGIHTAQHHITSYHISHARVCVCLYI